jgi:signal transduction histidine kinase
MHESFSKDGINLYGLKPVGISEEIKPKLFQPMVTTKSRGQGLGLVVVKRLVEALNGKISFESQEGKGTTFIVRLPPQRNER